MKKTQAWILAGLVAILTGCSNPDAAKNTETGDKKAAASADQPIAPVTKETGGAEIPESLRGNVYDLYGLGNSEKVSYRSTTSGTSMNGSTTTKLKEVKDGEAVFSMERDGFFAQLGSCELALREDGLYFTVIQGRKLEKPALELPSDIAPGKTWNSEHNIDLDVAGSIKKWRAKTQQKAVGFEKVKVPLGEFEALKIVGTGEYWLDSSKSSIKSTVWLAKGIGMVKMTLQEDSGGVTRTSTVEAISKG